MSYEIFRVLCERKGVKPYEVSKATGIATATLSSWKLGKYVPKREKLQVLADYFGVSLEYLESGDQETEEGYYTDPETAKLAQEILDDPNLRALFSAARDLKPDELQAVATMLRKFKETNPDG